ncbi:MAG: hypothetical protein PVI33_04665 [Candidatus Omnitrophota bacterium]|jgi:hypothetical protein
METMSRKSLTVAYILASVGFGAWLGIMNPSKASALIIGCFTGTVVLIIISVIALNKEKKTIVK